MEWYSFANFFLVLGAYLSLVAPLGSYVPFVDISPTTAAVMGVACLLIGILQRLEALLEQVSRIDFDAVCRRPAVRMEEE